MHDGERELGRWLDGGAGSGAQQPAPAGASAGRVKRVIRSATGAGLAHDFMVKVGSPQGSMAGQITLVRDAEGVSAVLLLDLADGSHSFLNAMSHGPPTQTDFREVNAVPLGNDVRCPLPR